MALSDSHHTPVIVKLLLLQTFHAVYIPNLRQHDFQLTILFE